MSKRIFVPIEVLKTLPLEKEFTPDELAVALFDMLSKDGQISTTRDYEYWLEAALTNGEVKGVFLTVEQKVGIGEVENER